MVFSLFAAHLSQTSRVKQPFLVALSFVALFGAACNGPERTAEQNPTAPAAPQPVAARSAAPAAPDSAQSTSFTWQDEVCQNTGHFAAGQYTQQQLRDAYKLVEYPSVMDTRDVWELAEMRSDTITRRLARLDAEHQRRITGLRGLEVVPQPYWRNLQQLRIREQEELYQLMRANFRGYLTPSALVSASNAPACRAYAQVLAGTDTAALVRAWRQLEDGQKARNGDPERLEAEFQRQNHSAQRLDYARLRLTKFGWWNCVNGARKHGDVYNQQQPNLAFVKLFTKIDQTDCADVD